MLNSEINHFTLGDEICSLAENPMEKYVGYKSENDEYEEQRHAKHNEMVTAPHLQPNVTKYNIDSHCGRETLFKEGEKEKFLQYLKTACLNQNQCTINFDKLEIKEGNVTKSMNFYEMISDNCYDRIYNKDITSIEWVIVAKCMNDEV